MTEEALLALDVGTSGCRAEVFALDGRSLGRHYVEYGLQAPVPGAAEQLAEDWWRAVVACTREALLLCKAGGAAAIRAIGLSVQGHSWVPVDGNLTPLRPALTWLDARAVEQARRLLEDHPLDFWGAHAGKQPGQWHLLPQLLWLRKTEPDVIARARYAMFAHDYLLARLTGRRVADFTIAAGSLLFDLQTWDWSADLLAEYQIEREMLPELLPAGTPAGTLTAAAAAELGLSGEVIVAVGAQDQKAAALAAGLNATTATASLGTATAITAPLDQPRFSPEHGCIPCFPYLKRGQYVLEAPLATAGGALRWLRDVVGQRGQDGYADMIAQAEAVPPGSDGVMFFPYLAGAASPHWRGEARGGFCGLSLHTGQGHLTRSVLEAIAYDIRANLDHMRALGCPVERLVLFGGGARSGLWPAIIAAVCGVPTYASTEAEAASRGAAMFAATAIGADTRPFALPAESIEPLAGWSAQYEASYSAWAAARERFWQL
ncbi:MAG: xylulokinase [Armatimonadota bacterium]